MATATDPAKRAAELAKLSLSDLTDKLDEAKKLVNALVEVEDRDDDQDAELIDRLDEAEAIQNALTTKRAEDTRRRVDRVRNFDPPGKRKAGANSSPDNFSSFGERLQAVSRSRITGNIDPRLLRNTLGANEGIPSDGGFLVGTDFETELQSKMFGDESWLGMIPRTPISAGSNMLKLRLLKETSRADGSRQGTVQAYWEGEGDSTTASRREYEELELTLRKLMAVSYASSELLEDAAALEAETSAGYNEEMSFKLGDAVINGNGIGKPKGIMNSGSKITVTAEAGQGTSQPLLYENIVKMWARLHPRSQSSAVWMVDQTLIPYLFTLGLTFGTAGTPVYLPPGGASASPYGTIFGRPVVHSEFTQAANTEGDIILWDPKQYRLIEKGGIKGASSIHVAFLTDEVAYRFTYRVNGASKWRAALTPFNGGATVSNIVTLATRT